MGLIRTRCALLLGEAGLERTRGGFPPLRHRASSGILETAMSEADVRIVRGMWEAFQRRDFSSSLAAFDPAIEWDGTNLPDGTVSRGIDAVVDHTRRWAEMWEGWEVELEDVIDAGGGRVIAFTRERGHSKSGLEMDERHSELYVVNHGKIVYRKGFSDADEALVEAGLR